jgi:hypothetical protein
MAVEINELTQSGGSSGPGPAPGLRASGRAALRPWIGWLSAIGWAEVLLVGAHRLSPGVALAPVLAFVIGFGAVVGTSLLCAARCPLAGPRLLAWLALPAAGLIALQLHSPGELEQAMGVTACLLFGGTLLGTIVGGAIEHPGHLVFVAIVSAAADVFSVFHPSGPSAAVAQSEAALSVLALPWPMLGTRAIEAFLGIGDVIFTALYMAAARRHALSLGRTALALTLGYVVTMVAVVALEVAVPALPFLGLSMVAAHAQARTPPSRDRLRGYATAAAVVAVVAVLLLR